MNGERKAVEAKDFVAVLTGGTEGLTDRSLEFYIFGVFSQD